MTSEESHLPTKFTLFPILPLELRLKIWEFISPGPRLVAIGPKERHWRNPYSTSGYVSLQNQCIPITLHICQESRTEALKSYRPAFGTPFCPPKVYIDFSLDIVRFGNGPSIEEARHPNGDWTSATNYMLDIALGGGPHGADDTEKVRKLLLDVDESLYARRNFCWDEIREFTALRELTILVWEPDYVQTTCMDQYRATLVRVKRAHLQWAVPRIWVINAFSGSDWGELTVVGLE